MWYYTKEFEAITSDPPLYMAGLVNHANTAYQNSNLNLRLSTMCIERLPDSFVEADNVNTLFTNFLNAKGIYRVTHHVDSNLPLTSKQKFHFGLACLDLARPKQNFCSDDKGRFEST